MNFGSKLLEGFVIQEICRVFTYRSTFAAKLFYCFEGNCCMKYSMYSPAQGADCVTNKDFFDLLSLIAKYMGKEG